MSLRREICAAVDTDHDLLRRTQRRDPIRGLIVGHAEAWWMVESRRWADAAAWIAVVLLALAVGGVAS